MTDLIDQIRNEIAARMDELAPLLDEWDRLRAVSDALEKIAGWPAITAADRKRYVRDSGGRGEQALAMVQHHPGIDIGELNRRLGITSTYLYRVLPRLEFEGRVLQRADGRWYPTGI